MEITEFLLARIEDDERGVRSAVFPRLGDQRILAECEAKRRIVDQGRYECDWYIGPGSRHYPDPDWDFCDGCSAAEAADRGHLWTLRVLAGVYADHPDYDQAWASA